MCYAYGVLWSDTKRQVFNLIDFIDKQLECRKTHLLYYSPNITVRIIGEEIKMDHDILASLLQVKHSHATSPIIPLGCSPLDMLQFVSILSKVGSHHSCNLTIYGKDYSS